MPEFTLSLHYSNKAYRIAVSALFFFQGLCFATWASRIPSIQHNLQLSDATLGLILFALPFGSMIALPISGWAVTRYGSKRVATNAILLYSLILAGLGLAQNVLSGMYTCRLWNGVPTDCLRTYACRYPTQFIVQHYRIFPCRIRRFISHTTGI